MPIKIPDRLPAADILRNENIFVMPETRAIHQDIRPLRLVILNLMPQKIETETQFLRLLSNTPLQVDVELLRIDNRPSRHTPQEHLDTFYREFDRIKDQRYDGMIITGAPLGLVDFTDVLYWDQIRTIMDWAEHHVTSTMFVCWAVQAGLHYLYGLDKQIRPSKLSGVYHHQTQSPHEPLTRGFDEWFMAPHSRYAEIPTTALRDYTDVQVLAESEEAGWYLAASKDARHVFVSGHPEYDVDSLDREYKRDLAAGIHPQIPVNYYPDNDPARAPRATWRSHGSLLFANWLNYYVYQLTPFNLEAGK